MLFKKYFLAVLLLAILTTLYLFKDNLFFVEVEGLEDGKYKLRTIIRFVHLPHIGSFCSESRIKVVSYPCLKAVSVEGGWFVVEEYFVVESYIHRFLFDLPVIKGHLYRELISPAENEAFVK